MSSDYSFTSFKCQENDPKTEWVFSLIVIGILYLIFFIFYTCRIIKFCCKKQYTIKSLMSRILFAFSLLVKGIFSILIGIGFQKDIEFSVFKYLVTDLPDYIICSAITYMLYSWAQVFLFSGLLNLTNSLSIIQIAIVGYNAFIYIAFSVLLLLRCTYTESALVNWFHLTRIFIIIANVLLIGLFIMALFIMKNQLHFNFSCNLGDSQNYLFMLCSFFIIILTTQSAFNIILCLNEYKNIKECSETRLILIIITECIGKILPLGFISFVDVFSLPPPEVKPALSIFDD